MTSEQSETEAPVELEQESSSPLLEDAQTEPGGARNGNVKACQRLVIALLFVGCLLALRPQSVAGSQRPEGLELWIPTGWHKDARGNDVKDTWDHYQMPACDPGPPPGTMKKVHLSYQRKMKDVSHDEEVEKEKRRLRGLENATKNLEDHKEKDHKGKTYRWVPVKRTPEQERCARHRAIATADHKKMVEAHYAFVRHRDEVRALHYWQGQRRCGPQYANTDFQAPAPQWQEPSGAASPAHCQRSCTENPTCQGFSWNSWGCFLKKLPKHKKSFTHKHKAGVWSGYHCARKEKAYPWINDELEKHTLPKPKAWQKADASMFCTMLLLPYSYEVDLTIMQYENYYSIFGCDYWKLYSSQRMVLKRHLHTHLINTSQVAEMAGQWGTALNTPAFLAYWRALLQDGDYLKARWLVKVDPDTVWFPNRLRAHLAHAEAKYDMKEPVYLNNCKQGLHGPIEVLSQSAFSTLARVSSKCYWAMQHWGNWQWGEDMWLDHCLITVAHATRVYVPKLLAEDHCNNWPGWRSCAATDMVAFHPFKEAQDHIRCTETGITTTVTATTTSITRTLTMTTTTLTVTKTETQQNPMQNFQKFVGNIFHR